MIFRVAFIYRGHVVFPKWEMLGDEAVKCMTNYLSFYYPKILCINDGKYDIIKSSEQVEFIRWF